MTQLDDLQSFVNLELPRRRTLLTVAITGYDENPNDAAAPAIIQGAPAGSYYLRETDTQLYEKLVTGTNTWQPTKSRGATKEALIIPVDYTSSVDPPAGLVLSTQQDVDDALIGASGFKHLNAVFQSLPSLLRHSVTVNMAAGVHRPEAGASIAWQISSHILEGSISVNGPVSASWPTVIASTAITGVQLGSDNPYMDFAASSFPNDGSLKGKHARISTGQLTVIHDHTDSRLFVVNLLSPDPTGGSAEVVEPAAELRNSLDDIATEAQSGCMIISHGSRSPSNFSELNDLIIDSFDANSTDNFPVDSCLHLYNRCQIRMEGGNGISPRNDAELLMSNCSIVGDPPLSGTSKTDRIINCQNSVLGLFGGYCLGGEDGVIIENGKLTLFEFVLDEVGSAAIPAPGLFIKNSDLIGFDFSASKTPEVRNTNIGLLIQDSLISEGGVGFGFGLVFSNCSSNCVEIAGGVTTNIASALGFSDGGGNLGLGIKISGSLNIVDLPSATTVTGTVGDIEIEGVAGSYAELVAASTLSTKQFNKVSKL